MKSKKGAQLPQTFGEFIACAYRSCSKHKAMVKVQRDVNANFIQFRSRRRFIVF